MKRAQSFLVALVLAGLALLGGRFSTSHAATPAQVLIYAVFYDTYQPGEPDEAFALYNTTATDIDLTGWQVTDGEGTLTFPVAVIQAGQILWVARTATAFAQEFGFAPDFEYETDSDPNVPNLIVTTPIALGNSGDELLLLRPDGSVEDTVVYEEGDTTTPGWSGPAIQPYTQGYFGIEGQVLYRKLAPLTGRPVPDTNTLADWAQDPNDPLDGQKVRYPGWDLEHFYLPLQVTEFAHVTYSVGPDHLFETYLAEIQKATRSIYIETYAFTNPIIADTLIAKLQQGIQVIVLLEGDPAFGMDDQERWICQRLESAGGQCWFIHNDSANGVHDRYAFQHAKITIVDEKILLTGSENLGKSSMPFDDKSDGTWGNRGVYLITDAPSLVQHALDIFWHDLDPSHPDIRRWDPVLDAPSPGFVPVYESGGTDYAIQFPEPLRLSGAFSFEVAQSPENSLRSQGGLLGMVARAGQGGMVLVEQLYEYPFWGPTTSDPATDPNPRLEAYIDAARRGATVRILLDGAHPNTVDPNNVRSNTNTCDYVNSVALLEGLDLACLLGNPAGNGIHNKMVLVWDGTHGWVHTGSINGSENSSKQNRELAIQVQSDEAFNYLAQVFEYDWTTSGGAPIFGTTGAPDHLLISEVFYDTPSDDNQEEWVEIYNPTTVTVDLSDYKLGDEETPGSGEGMHRFPQGATLAPGAKAVIALRATGFYALYGQWPDYEIFDTTPQVPDMIRYTTWATGNLSLANRGDEVLLLGPDDTLVDGVSYGRGNLPGVLPHPGVPTGHTLERFPLLQDTDNAAQDFIDQPSPTPW